MNTINSKYNNIYTLVILTEKLRNEDVGAKLGTLFKT